MATATFKFVQSPKVVLGDVSQDNVSYYGTIVFSAAADTYATGGISPTTGFGLAALGPYANRTPLEVRIYSQAGQSWQYIWNSATSKLMIFSGGASGANTTATPELTNATALNATTPTVSTDVVAFTAIFPQSMN